MLADIRYWENKAKEGKYAIPHFNVWNAEMLMGVMDAAEESKAPIIISFGTGFVGNTCARHHPLGPRAEHGNRPERI